MSTALLDAHVAHELSAWTENVEQTLQQEVDAIWHWASATPLNKLTNAKRVKSIAQRLVIDMPLPDSIAELVAGIAVHLIQLPINRETQISDVVSEELVDSTVEQILALSELRDAIIAGSVESPLFSMLVSDILYNGIRGYMVAGTEKLGSMSGLLSKGAGAIGKRLDGQMEKRLRGYIENNAKVIGRQSQTFLQEALTESRIRELVDEIWTVVQDSHLSVAELIDEDEVRRFAAFGQQVWESLRETEYMQQMIFSGIDAYFAQFGRKKISAVLDAIGVDNALLQTEAAAIAPAVLQSLNDTGYLEATIRRRLESFYNSEAAAKLLA